MPKFDKFFWYNIKQVRIISRVPPDMDLKRNYRWTDLLYTAFSCWDFCIKALLNGEKIPAGVVLVGAFITQEDMDWAERTAKELKLAQDIFR